MLQNSLNSELKKNIYFSIMKNIIWSRIYLLYLLSKKINANGIYLKQYEKFLEFLITNRLTIFYLRNIF